MCLERESFSRKTGHCGRHSRMVKELCKKMNGFHHYTNNLDGHSSRIIVWKLLQKKCNGTSLLFLVQTAIIGYIITFLLEIVESMGNLYKNVHFIIFHTGNLIGWSIIYRFWYFFLSRIQKIHDLFPKKASKQQWTFNFWEGGFLSSVYSTK